MALSEKKSPGSQATAVAATERLTQSFTDAGQWPRLKRTTGWEWNAAAGEILGAGVHEFLLSTDDYGKRDYVIKARLSFANYSKYRDSGLDTANAGIVLGWREVEGGKRYHHLLFNGQRMVLEAIGFKGGDDYLDFKHCDAGSSFVIEDNRFYNITISVSRSFINVFVDDVHRYSVQTPESIQGRVGLRPWRASIRCKKFVVFES
ncbi:MAG TPA: hypothetical protein VKY85_05315 [Candidatus Angelobacter sp.]|nr:hypothetical protein [Candidatus Angelobacter sp.]